MDHKAFTTQWPDFDGSLWAATASPDVAIVGVGYHLAGAGVSSAVLEARAAGFGGSGRNSGNCVPEWLFQTPGDIERMYGAACRTAC